MDILHITPSTNGYEEVELLANRVSEKNHLALIRDKEGEKFMTGGFLIMDTPETRNFLDSFPKPEQHRIISLIREIPFARLYSEE